MTLGIDMLISWFPGSNDNWDRKFLKSLRKIYFLRKFFFASFLDSFVDSM